jgi:murein DD-endopeptidase MepM/ murein hydrolase activator NlpD
MVRETRNPDMSNSIRGRMIYTSFSKVFRGVAVAVGIAGFSLASAASATDAAPVDLDSPDTAVDTVEAQQAIAAADATAAAMVSATPTLAQRVNGQPAGDTQFRSLFAAWRQMDGPAQQALAIPSRRPVDQMSLTSRFGVRNDPFNGRRARHNGIDIPGPIGTPIFATADGTIGRAQWVNGYGKYVEIEHGHAMQTRYGHLSQIAVEPGQRIRRGDIIGYMGSTGRSTGSHLHYEVRIAGAPVNPIPFIADDGVMVAAAGHGSTALGGPRE